MGRKRKPATEKRRRSSKFSDKSRRDIENLKGDMHSQSPKLAPQALGAYVEVRKQD